MPKTKKRIGNVRELTFTAILIALIVILTLTPLGYLKLGIVEPTIMMIPVVIGAILMGPRAGALLGLAFGLSSFFTCFGFSAFGTTLFSINPIATFITCVIPRVIMGFLCGLIFCVMNRRGNHTVVASTVTSIAGALLNTVLFVSSLLVFFRYANFEPLGINLGSMTLWEIISVLFLFNAIAEVILCAVVGTALSNVLSYVFRRYSK